MSTITVKWKLSKEAQTAEFVATGEKPDENYSVMIDLVDCTPAERELLIRGDTARFSPISLSWMPEFDETRKDFEKPAYLSPKIYYDSEPSLTQILAYIKAVEDVQATIQSYVAEKAEQERREQERLLGLYDEFLPRVEALIEARDYEALGKLPPSLSIPGDVFVFRHRTGESLSHQVGAARKEILKERRENAKSKWIGAHGSVHLKRAFGAGYDSQRQYVIERAARELPDFTVDFNDEANWQDRPFPSTSALDLADAVASLGDAQIAWLTHPAQSSVDDEFYDEWEKFESREAVIVRAYLGKYDVVSDG